MSELLLLSGGIDSVAVAAWRRPSLCLTVDYGQAPAEAEFEAAKQVCSDLGLDWMGLTVPIRSLGSGNLASCESSPHSPHKEFWPFRNQFLITLAAMAALKHACTKVLIGTVSTDERHQDGTPRFIKAADLLIQLQEGGLQIGAPAIGLTTIELIRKSGISNETLGWTHSCHVSNLACGACNGCIKHSNIFHDLYRSDTSPLIDRL